MSSKSMVPILLGVVACCCLSSVVAGGLWAGNVLCDTTDPGDQSVGMNCASVYESSGSPATGTPAAAGTPRQRLIATGQAIQVAEVDISTAPPAFTVPTGVPTTGAVSYSMTMDVNIAQAGPSWRNIMNHGDPDYGTTTRRPAIFITGNADAPPNRIRIAHGSTEDNGTGINTTFAATPGTYFTLTLVVNAGTLTTYVNGTVDASGTASATFNWNDAAQPWRWNAYLTQLPGRAGNTSGTVKVKNAYWFNKALTAAEITTLVGTTSGYMPQPLSMGVSGYTKEGYMVPY